MMILAHIALFALAQVVVTITAIPTSSVSPSYSSGKEFRDTILQVTNKYRNQHNAAPLAWDDSLAHSSYDWAKQCKWGHSGDNAGENLAMTFPDVTSAVEAWGDERRLYNFKNPGFSEQTGHFSQLVWKATTKVGCGRFDCGNGGDGRTARGWYIVCQYSPPGNVIGGDYFKNNVQGHIRGDRLESGADGHPEAYELWKMLTTGMAVSMGVTGLS